MIKLQMLVHPLWYYEKEISIGDALKKIIESSVHDRFLAIKENISNTDEILNEKDYI